MHVVVVGTGGAGAMAAWRLARRGHRVTVLERFRVDHDYGSSYGDSRIVRRVYPDALYTALMRDAYRLWADLMRESGSERLLVQSGGLFFGRADDAQIVAAERALVEAEVPFRRLDSAEAGTAFPAFRFSPDEVGLYEPSMGYARASLAVQSAVELARRAGAEIRQECAAAAIEPEGSGVCVRLEAGGAVSADAAVLSVGPWAAPVLQQFGLHPPLTVTRQAYLHLLPQRYQERFLPERFPVWIDAGANAYGFPQIGDLPGIKIALHEFGETVTPEGVERRLTDADRSAILAYARRRFPGSGESIAYEKVCLYTVTPDSDFIVDTVPGYPQILCVSACSGHGFKFTPLIGEMAALLTETGDAPWDLSRFRLSRW